MGKNKTVVTQTRVTFKGNKKRRKNIEYKTTAYRKKPSKPTDILWCSRKKSQSAVIWERCSELFWGPLDSSIAVAVKKM